MNDTMEWITWNFLTVILIILAPAVLLYRIRNTASKRLPPGPPGLPLFGNMLNLGRLPHRYLTQLQRCYGPVVLIKIGSIKTVVIQNANTAAELFKNHDLAFGDRPVLDTMRSHDHYKIAMTSSTYGSLWRVIRRLSTIELFVSKKLSETTSVREKCVQEMIRKIEKETQEGKGIIVTKFVFFAVYNILGNIMLSRDMINLESNDGVGIEFEEVLGKIAELLAAVNVSDMVPWVRRLDLQGLRKKTDREMDRAFRIISEFVKEHLRDGKESRERRSDYLDMLMEFEGSKNDEPAKLSEQEICTNILELFLAGTETSVVTIEWAFAELLHNPEIMTKVKDELSKVVGKRKVQESDVENLQYLQLVIKETLRLHPPLPFLVPRNTPKDTDFMGYHIPKDTMVFVNTWSIGRDPEIWEDPLIFKPERFDKSKIEYRGQHFDLIPFGSGRRMCPGLPLAYRMVHLILGSLVHEFDWELDDKIVSYAIDIQEKLAVLLRKANSLKAIPKRVGV